MTLKRSGTIGIALLLCVIIVQSAFSTPFENGTKTLQTEIDDFMAERMETLNMPGAAIGVVQGDQVLYVQGYGTASSSATVTPQTPFLLAVVWGTIRTGLVYRAGYGK